MASASLPLFLQPRTAAFQLRHIRLKPPNYINNGGCSPPPKSVCPNVAVRHSSSVGLSIPRKRGRSWRLSSAAEDALPLDAASVEGSSPEIISSGDEGASTIIQVLLFAAFVGLSILTIGVIYIAVTDFLQKREREKFEKEEAAKAKKGGKKGKVRARARAGPRGFGQKPDPDESDD
ncbi:hypothetical protein MLD38_008364 [Melastoma candidum]|uniref:Uncharacterized protein n=1 Tax=Melastoma candidum TaxID=119954 RepID=A0ACB9RVY4_9MYRT|nr:hypothetical protein MLD38_008364 [Melastoma candidum]